MTLENLQQALGENNKELIKRLSHENQDILDKFSVDEDGNVLYNGEKIISDIKISEAANNYIIKKEDGIYVGQDKELADKVNTIKAYQRYTNAELEYGYFGIYSNGTGLIGFANMNPVKLDKKYGNIDYPIILHKDKKYKITVTIAFQKWNCDECYGAITAYVDNQIIGAITLQGNDKVANGHTHTETQEYIIEAGRDSEFKLISNLYNGKISLGRPQSSVIIEEIGHDIVIDPLEYVNDQQGIEDCPVGHILSFMGNIPPKHYLMCDGSEYTISEYPYLAEHIRENFGSYDFFGGNGTITFAVPDLRGEFLRGTGTAARNTGSGLNTGQHQDATEVVNAIAGYASKTGNNWGGIVKPRNVSNNNITISGNVDKEINTSGNTLNYFSQSDSNGETTSYENWNYSTMPSHYTTRPTNTSVMYCIKYEPTYYFHHTTNTTVHETKNITENITKEISSLDYLQTHADLEGVPIGHILSYMGNTAPKHYLKCDGAIYNISKYPLLAEHIKAQFGNYNYWGGDGSTTFAVPDLRGEFLRGAETNSHTNQGNGASVGQHQDATEDIRVWTGDSLTIPLRTNSLTSKCDKFVSLPGGAAGICAASNVGTRYTDVGLYTSRPTNTSVMWCIKYEPTYALSEKDEITDAELQQAILETIEILNEKEDK